MNRQPSLPGEIGSTLAGWFAAQVKIVLILIGIYAIGFARSGVPWWFAVAVVCGVLNFIPIGVFGIEAALGRSFAAIEIGGALLVIGALVANNLYLRGVSTRR